MFIKYVLIAILILLLISILYDVIKGYMTKRKEKGTRQAIQDEPELPDEFDEKHPQK